MSALDWDSEFCPALCRLTIRFLVRLPLALHIDISFRNFTSKDSSRPSTTVVYSLDHKGKLEELAFKGTSSP